jgi:RimJ/RimL family protein N-acetyltransferase
LTFRQDRNKLLINSIFGAQVLRMSQIFIETPRLFLREWQQSDHEPFIALNADAEVMEFFPKRLSREETLAQIGRITVHFERYGFGLFAAERKDNGQFIGFTGLAHINFDSYFTPGVEIGWRLSRANWERGFATEAAEACIQYGTHELNLKEIYSFTSVHNKRSERVMKNIGMQKAGEFDHPLVTRGDFLERHVLYKIAVP